jgi:hypothetical protein
MLPMPPALAYGQELVVGVDGRQRGYAAKRGSRPLIGVTAGVFQSVPQWSRRRSR